MPAIALTIVTWLLRVLLAALFLFAAYMKLSGNAHMVAEFGTIGLGDWFRIFTGAVEVVGAIALLNPGTTPWGALWLLCVDIGAFLTQAFVLHGDIVHTLVIGAALLVLFYLTRHPVLKLVGGTA